MTDLASSLHSWLDPVDPSNNGLDWYQHVVSRDLACGCRLPSTYCTEWKPIAPPAGPRVEAHSFWLHTEPDPITDEEILAEAPRRRYVILNAREHLLVKRFKAINPDILVFVYKDLSSVRSYDGNPDVRVLPAGMSYGYAKTMPQWQAQDTSGRWLTYANYPGHYQMDVGQPGYQKAWGTNVARMKELGFDGIWMDNALWRRDTYHEGTPVKGYASDEAFREAYRSFFRAVCPRLKAAGLLCVANMSNARLIQGGWNSYLDSGLDGGFDEWWLNFGDDNLLSEYPEGWRRQVDEIAYTESQGKICLVQPHFTPGNTRAFRYALASYFMGFGGKAAIAELDQTDDYAGAPPWHPEFDWDLGVSTGNYRALATANLFRRDFSEGCVVVNANKTGTPVVTHWLGGTYLNEEGESVSSVSLPGTSGAILRKVS